MSLAEAPPADPLASEASALQPHAAELSEAQQHALATMTETFHAEDGYGLAMTDKTYLRYLRARNWNIKKASDLLRSTLKWRKDFGVADMDSWKDVIAKENATGKTFVRGFDKNGHVLIVMRPARENTKDHLGQMKHLVYTLERAVACLEAAGRGTEKWSLLIDYQGYSLAHAPPMKTARETLTILQDHYPERLLRAYCMFPPFVFWAFYKVVTPFIDPVTKAKIVMLKSSEMAKPTNQLFREVDRSVLETAIGGEDDRPFDSATYLSGPFNQEFTGCLDSK